MDAKAFLFMDIAIPSAYAGKIQLEGNTEILNISDLNNENMEFSGKAKNVICRKTESHVELNTNEDLEITLDKMCGTLDVNQMSATSKLFLDGTTTFATRTKGIANRILTGATLPNEKALEDEPVLTIELNGMKSELAISLAKEVQ